MGACVLVSPHREWRKEVKLQEKLIVMVLPCPSAASISLKGESLFTSQGLLDPLSEQVEIFLLKGEDWFASFDS